MTHGEIIAEEFATGRKRRDAEPLIVTSLADDPAGVERALDALYTAGIPRDLVEVVVSRHAAQRFYGGTPKPRVRRPGRETFRYAGIGGLVGFIGGVLLSLVMVAWPGLDAPGGLAIVQLAGPNFGTVTGAAAGALVGWFKRQRPDARHARAAEAANAIVVSVTARNEGELDRVMRLLASAGGRDVRREPRAAKRN